MLRLRSTKLAILLNYDVQRFNADKVLAGLECHGTGEEKRETIAGDKSSVEFEKRTHMMQRKLW